MGNEEAPRETSNLVFEAFCRSFSVQDMQELEAYQRNFFTEGGEGKKGVEGLIDHPISDRFIKHFPDDYQVLTHLEEDVYDDKDCKGESGNVPLIDEIYSDPILLKILEFQNRPRGLSSRAQLDITNQDLMNARRARIHVIAYLRLDSPMSPLFIERPEDQEEKDQGDSDLKDAG